MNNKALTVLFLILCITLISGCEGVGNQQYNNSSVPAFGNGKIAGQENSSLAVYWSDDNSYVIIRNVDVVSMSADKNKEFAEAINTLRQNREVDFIVPCVSGGYTDSYTIYFSNKTKSR